MGQGARDQLDHSAWHGFTFYDLIFPLFLFLAGVSIPIALEKRMARGEARFVLVRHVLWRTVKLFFFGLLVNGLLNLNFPAQRWPGVLQRIAIGYCAASLAVLFLSRRAQAILAAALLVGYWIVLLVVPVPDIGAYVLTPEGNLAGYLDRLLIPGQVLLLYLRRQRGAAEHDSRDRDHAHRRDDLVLDSLATHTSARRRRDLSAPACCRS